VGNEQEANMREQCQGEFAALVALDWGERKHAWVLEDGSSGKRERGVLEQRPETIQAWAMSLARRYPGQRVAVGLEQKRGAVVYALQQYEHVVVFPIHPSTATQFRKALYPSGATDDGRDAEALLELMKHHGERLRRLEPDSAATRKLQGLVEARRGLVEERTAQTNHLQARLKWYYPQLLEWFDDLASPLLAAFVERWPTLGQLQQARPGQLRKFLQQRGCSAQRIEQRLAAIAEAQALTQDEAVVEPAVLLVRSLLRTIAVLRESIAELEQRIEQLLQAHPDYAIVASFPGAGKALQPRLLAALGSRRERWQSAEQLQCYSGIAPVVERSGNSQQVHFRWACPKFVRQTFHEFALHSIRQCGWARQYYEHRRARGMSHQAAVRTLAYKWIRIIYRCWKDRVPYEEQRYRGAYRKTPEPTSQPPQAPPQPQDTLLASAATVNFLFKPVAGFWKFAGLTP
jgi:transposase